MTHLCPILPIPFLFELFNPLGLFVSESHLTSSVLPSLNYLILICPNMFTCVFCCLLDQVTFEFYSF